MSALTLTALQRVTRGVRGRGQEEATKDNRLNRVILTPALGEVTNIPDKNVCKGLQQGQLTERPDIIIDRF